MGASSCSTPRRSPRRLSTTKALTAAGAAFGSDALAFWQEYTPGTPDPAAVAAAQAAAQAAPAGGGGGRGAGGGGPVIPMIPGQAWLLAATKNSVVAWKIVDQGGSPTLQPGWTSRALGAPATPVIVNNVVFAVSSGKPAAAGGAGTPAVLYALNAHDRQGDLEQRHDDQVVHARSRDLDEQQPGLRGGE